MEASHPCLTDVKEADFSKAGLTYLFSSSCIVLAESFPLK